MLIIVCLETICQDVSLLFCSFFQAGASLAACPKPFARVVLLFTYFFPSFDSVSLLLLLLVHTPTCRCGLPGSLGLHRQGRQVLGMLNPSFSLNGGDLWGFPSGENRVGRSRGEVQWSLKFWTDWECTHWNAFISCDWCRLLMGGNGDFGAWLFKDSPDCVIRKKSDDLYILCVLMTGRMLRKYWCEF